MILGLYYDKLEGSEMTLASQSSATAPTPKSKSGLMPLFRILAVLLLMVALQLPFSSPLFAVPDDPKLANDRCLRCHGKENFSRKAANGEERDLHVTAEAFAQSVHGSRDCVN